MPELVVLLLGPPTPSRVGRGPYASDMARIADALAKLRELERALPLVGAQERPASVPAAPPRRRAPRVPGPR